MNDQPSFEEFAHNPMAYARAVEPTEEQERVAKELRGLHIALTREGFSLEQADDLVKTYLDKVLSE